MTSGRVMIVDDDVDVREAMDLSLSLDGFETVLAGDGSEAFECLREPPPPDVILLDLMMPTMNGREFLQLLRQNPETAGLRAVILSGDGEVRQTALALGADDWIAKPVEIDHLLAVVHRWTADSQAIRRGAGTDGPV